MTQFIKNNMKLVLVSILVLIAAFVYFNFFSGEDTAPLVTGATAENDSPVSKDLLVTLSHLHVINLDASLFENPVFLSLSDFGVQIPVEIVGRRNPFAPLGSN